MVTNVSKCFNHNEFVVLKHELRELIFEVCRGRRVLHGKQKRLGLYGEQEYGLIRVIKPHVSHGSVSVIFKSTNSSFKQPTVSKPSVKVANVLNFKLTIPILGIGLQLACNRG